MLTGMFRLFIFTAIQKHSETYRRYAMFFVHRHYFLKLKRSTLLIQQTVRNWISWRHQQKLNVICDLALSDRVAAATIVQKFIRGWFARSRYICILDQKAKASNLYQQKVMFYIQTKSALRIQLAWKKYICYKSTQRHFSAIKIQCNFRRWLLTKRFLNLVQATLRIQCYFRMSRCVKTFQRFKITFKAAIVIQSFVRAWIARKEANARRNHIVAIQVRH